MTRQEELKQEAARSARDPRTRFILLVLSLASAILMITVIVLVYRGWSNANEDALAGQKIAENVGIACEDPKLKRDLETSRPGICDQAENVEKQGPQGEPGVPGEPGPPPSDAQIADAVARYCAGDRCDGRNGQNATPAQVADAVSMYCNNRGECQGSDGKDGGEGPRGPQGPGPSDDQILAAVQQFCSNDRCKGDTGGQGPEGPSGPSWTVVTHPSCDEGTSPITGTSLRLVDGVLRLICFRPLDG